MKGIAALNYILHLYISWSHILLLEHILGQLLIILYWKRATQSWKLLPLIDGHINVILHQPN